MTPLELPLLALPPGLEPVAGIIVVLLIGALVASIGRRQTRSRAPLVPGAPLPAALSSVSAADLRGDGVAGAGAQSPALGSEGTLPAAAPPASALRDPAAIARRRAIDPLKVGKATSPVADRRPDPRGSAGRPRQLAAIPGAPEDVGPAWVRRLEPSIRLTPPEEPPGPSA